MSSASRARGAVYLSLAVAIAETGAVAAAAVVTGSSAVVAQTFANVADVGVQVFLVIAVARSARPPDAGHPLGYGRERFFWSLFAAIGVFAGGCAVALEEAIRNALHPTEVRSFAVGYVVLAGTVVLDCGAFAVATRTIRAEAGALSFSVSEYLRRTVEPATTTEVVGNGIGVTGALLGIAALAITQRTGSTLPDAVASGLIGLALMGAAVVLIQRNRDLLTGRGIPPEVLEQMRRLIVAHPGVVDVPDLFAVVVGPATLIVDGEVTFRHELSAADIETAIDRTAAALRARWPTVAYVYLTPVSTRRPRGRSLPASAPDPQAASA